MIETTIKKMHELVISMQNSIHLDIEDIKAARHEKLLDRNDEKQQMMDEIVLSKGKLNNLLVESIQEGIDVNIYRDKVDNLEDELKKLYKLNAKLGSIVLPIKKMYKDMVDELTAQNGGNIFEIKV